MPDDGNELEADEEANRENGCKVNSDTNAAESVGIPEPFTGDGSLGNVN